MENTPEEAKVTPIQLHEASNDLEKILGLASNEEGGEGAGVLDAIGSVLSLDEDQFSIVAPGIMQSFSQSVNNPNDKIALVQAINASGLRSEDLSGSFEGICEEIEKLDISVQKRDFLKNIIGTIVNAVNDTEGIAKRNVQVAIELCHPNAKIPQYAHISDSGVDVYALDDITVKPGETVLVPTGIKVALPAGYELQVRPKSGRALKTKLRVANTPGTIDQQYRDEIKVIIENVESPIKDITLDEEGKVTSILYGSSFTIGKGEKFCQLVLSEVPKIAFYRVDSVLEIDKEDRGGGFGSSGLK
jgi:dUTP pyrophosphatase